MNGTEEATQYMEKHKIQCLFEELSTLLFHNRPEQPRAFLIDQLNIMRRGEELPSDEQQSMFFSKEDCETMFGMFDVTNTGYITIEQYEKALQNFGVSSQSIEIPSSMEKMDCKTFCLSVYVTDH